MASLTMFVTGALLSVRQGVLSLLHHTEAGSFLVSYLVLAVSLGLEGVSLLRAYRQLDGEARNLQRDFFEHLDVSSDPIARAVFAEDAAAVAGNVIAAVGLGLHQLTGSAVPDAVAAILVGLTLGYVAFQLARRNADFLVGKQASPEVRRQIAEIIGRQPGVRALVELLVVFVGPRRLWVVARVGVAAGLSGAALAALARETERVLVRQASFIGRVDVVVADEPAAP
jgi:divalent metal cation (Fe/Co/Zn/Cd) transporter